MGVSGALFSNIFGPNIDSVICLGIIISDYQLWSKKGFKTPKVSDQQNLLVQLEELPLVSLVARRVVDERPG